MKKEKILEIGKDVIERSPYAQNILVPPDIMHRSTFYKLTFIYGGEAEVEFYSRNGKDRKKQLLKMGDAFIITPKDVHKYIVKGDAKAYCHKDLYIMSEDMKGICDGVKEGLFEQIVNLNYPPVFKMSLNTVMSISELIAVIVGKLRSEKYDVLAKASISYFLAQYVLESDKEGKLPKWLIDLTNNVKSEEYLTLDVEDLIKTTNYSHGYVCREFKKYLGLPLKSYLTREKLYVASGMLLTTSISLEEIAERLSFSTTSNFVSLFKSEFGITPGKYRKQLSKFTF